MRASSSAASSSTRRSTAVERSAAAEAEAARLRRSRPGGRSTATSTSTSTRSSRSHALSVNTNNSVAESKQDQDYGDDNPDLVQLEQRLNEEVDEEFFQEPRKFHTLHRVIDVLGMQLETTATGGGGGGAAYGSNGNGSTPFDTLMENPAYRRLQDQQALVEEAIEHLAFIHCADLNGSVVQVGRVARQFQDAVTQVKQLRGRVQEIQETLGSNNSKNAATTTTTAGGAGATNATGKEGDASQQQQSTVAQTTAMSLRELWLKKLEAEAVLSLLDKLDRIRAAPKVFDSHLEQCRLGAAVIGAAQALDTMFSSDVSQVQALHKIMEQLMMRKQQAEEVVWEVLLDVLFLRTANGQAMMKLVSTATTATSHAGQHQQHQAQQPQLHLRGGGSGMMMMMMCNPFLHPPAQLVYCLESDLSIDHATGTTGTMAAILGGANHNAFSLYEEQQQQQYDDWQTLEQYETENMMIPPSLLEAEFDLESEEKRHLEEWKDHRLDSTGAGRRLGGGEKDEEKQQPMSDLQLQQHQQLLKHQRLQQQLQKQQEQDDDDDDDVDASLKSKKKKKKPQYGDPVLALRTLVDCLIRLRRLDDVERLLTEALPKELERLVQREQAKTFLLVEQATKNNSQYRRSMSAQNNKGTDLRDFRKHLSAIISSFGNVQLRMAYLAQIIRHRLATEKMGHASAYNPPSGALTGALKTAKEIMERELKSFLDACLHATEEPEEPEFNINVLTNVSGQSRQVAAKTKAHRESMGLFSLGIVQGHANKDSAALTAEAWLTASTTSKRTKVQTYETPKFVSQVLFAKTMQNGGPQIRHALFFRRALSQWHHDSITLRKQLSQVTMEDAKHLIFDETPALEYLDVVIQKDLLPVLQEEAVNGTVQALERLDAFDPVLDRNVYSRSDSNEPQDVDMCRACNALYNFTGPLFLALHRLPKGGDMYLPLVAVLEHVILTFISRVKQQVQRLCQKKTALQLIMETTTAPTENGIKSFGVAMERRKAFAQLVLAYADGDLLEAAAVSEEAAESSGVPLLTPSNNDSPSKAQIQASRLAALGMDDLDFVGGVEREELNLSVELQFIKPFLEFAATQQITTIQTCTDEILMKSACLAHSLLKLSSLLDARCKVRSTVGGMATKTLSNTRALREAVKTIKANGLKMAKFCRADVLLQAITRLGKVCTSSTIVARDAVRIPSSVNDLGEYMTAASDNLREAAGNAVTAYTFSTLEQFIPLCLIQTVRVLAAGKGIILKAPLTMNGIEALDRSGSVLYRDLKGATSFDNSFWDIELAAVSFERSASFIAMMELEMSELEAYYQENRSDFSDQDFQLMFAMNGPRRKGDIGRYHMLVKRLDHKE